MTDELGKVAEDSAPGGFFLIFGTALATVIMARVRCLHLSNAGISAGFGTFTIMKKGRQLQKTRTLFKCEPPIMFLFRYSCLRACFL